MGCGKSFVLLLNNMSLFTKLSAFLIFKVYLMFSYFNTKSCLNETMIIFFPKGQHNHFHDMTLFLMNVFDSE